MTEQSSEPLFNRTGTFRAFHPGQHVRVKKSRCAGTIQDFRFDDDHEEYYVQFPRDSGWFAYRELEELFL